MAADNANRHEAIIHGRRVSESFTIITKICINFDRSITTMSCADRKYAFPIKTIISKQNPGHNCISEYMDNPLSDVMYFLFQSS